jgi:hypothetical protein
MELEKEPRGEEKKVIKGPHHLRIVSLTTNHLNDVTTTRGIPKGFASCKGLKHQVDFDVPYLFSPKGLQLSLIRRKNQVLARVLNFQLTPVAKEHTCSRLESFYMESSSQFGIVTGGVTNEERLWGREVSKLVSTIPMRWILHATTAHHTPNDVVFDIHDLPGSTSTRDGVFLEPRVK